MSREKLLTAYLLTEPGSIEAGQIASQLALLPIDIFDLPGFRENEPEDDE